MRTARELKIKNKKRWARIILLQNTKKGASRYRFIEARRLGDKPETYDCVAGKAEVVPAYIGRLAEIHNHKLNRTQFFVEYLTDEQADMHRKKIKELEDKKTRLRRAKRIVDVSDYEEDYDEDDEDTGDFVAAKDNYSEDDDDEYVPDERQRRILDEAKSKARMKAKRSKVA